MIVGMSVSQMVAMRDNRTTVGRRTVWYGLLRRNCVAQVRSGARTLCAVVSRRRSRGTGSVSVNAWSQILSSTSPGAL